MTQIKLENIPQDFRERLLNIRRQLHQNPELSSREFQTTALIRRQLEEMKLEMLELDMPTGVAALLQGKYPGPTIGIRADIDALPITENTGVDYSSKNPGIMHACGHDVHMTALLGAARLLCENRDCLHGRVLFLFQPAEETVLGALAVAESGLLERYAVAALICMHVWPGLPLGQVGLRSRAFLSGVSSFQITLTGQGGHGSMPDASINPIPAGAALALSLPGIVSYDLPPLEPAALSVCSIQAGACDNAIPDTCRLLGTARTFSEASHKKVVHRLQVLSKNTAAAYGCSAEVHFDHDIPPLVNADSLVQLMGNSANTVLGANAWQPMDPVMISEDFAFYGAHLPICCALFGVGTGGMLHSAEFYPPDDAPVAAAAFLCESVLEITASQAKEGV